MDRLQPLRPELASVCRYQALKRAEQAAREIPPAGVLAQLAAAQGLQ